MKKASLVLLFIGIVHSAYMLVLYVAFTITSFMISAPSYKPTLINQIQEGKVISNFSGTLEEQASQIQTMFLIIAIVVLLISLISLASTIFAFFMKGRWEKSYFIVTLVLGAVTLNIFFILASIFALVNLKREQDGETINVSY